MITCHNYTDEHRGWGHDYSYTPSNGGLQAHVMGHGLGLKVGDILLMGRSDKEGSAYRITAIKYFDDPKDMWSAEVEFAPGSLMPQPEREAIAKALGLLWLAD